MRRAPVPSNDPEMIPYRYPPPPEALPEIFVRNVMPEDERLWVPLKEGVWSRPLCFNQSEGYWTHLLRIRRAGVFNRHRHASPVHGFVLKGRWYYLEHDWIAEPGSYIFEPPGVPDDVEEMITYFHTTGTLTFVDPEGNVTGSEDVFARLKIAKDYFIKIGFGEDYIRNFIR